MSSLKSNTLTVSIARPPAEVYHFVSNPENMADWAASFCESVDRQEGDWILNTTNGQVKIRFVEQNPYGVLDHYVTGEGAAVYVPMRVVANGSGSEVIFTLFRTPDMDDARFSGDTAMVERDLQSLKRLLEG